MARSTPHQALETGSSVYRYVAMDWLLAGRELVADSSPQGEQAFHSFMEWGISIFEPLIEENRKEWDAEMARILVTPDGKPLQPHAHLSKRMRTEQAKIIMRFLFKGGVLWHKEKAFSRGGSVWADGAGADD